MIHWRRRETRLIQELIIIVQVPIMIILPLQHAFSVSFLLDKHSSHTQFIVAWNHLQGGVTSAP